MRRSCSGTKGLTRQRNRALDVALPCSDIIVFFDDDFLPEDTTLEGIRDLFCTHTEIVGATGVVLADGVTSGGLSPERARAILEAQRKRPRGLFNLPTDALYGCNMALRTSAIHDIRFDENLPLYAWQEDVDFTGQLRQHGLTVQSSAFAGVHLGVTKGRTSGLALGFSQIINPAYLVRKGTMRPVKAMILALKNIVANHMRSIHPESYIDRRGRARGNWLGLWYLLQGRLEPAAILQLLERRDKIFGHMQHAVIPPGPPIRSKDT